MPSTSIRLVFSNQDVVPELISDALCFPRGEGGKGRSSETTVSVVRSDAGWELYPNESPWLDVERLLPQWVSILEQAHAKLKALSDERLGGYLDVRVYEDDFFVDAELLSRLGATGIGISVWFNPPEQITWTPPEHEAQLTFPGPESFYCQRDEDHFFEWLLAIDGVKDVRGHLTDLTVFLSTEFLSEPALKDLIGLLYRYEVPMSCLRTQLTAKNEHWFKDPQKYWYENVFVNPLI